MDGSDPYVLGLKALALRDLSVAELRERLCRKGCEPGAVEAALSRLVDERRLDDRRVAEHLATTTAPRRHWGPNRLRLELERRGIERAIVRALVARAASPDDEDVALARTVAKLHLTVASPDETRRVYQRLLRRGFTPRAVRAALRKAGTVVDADD